MSGDFARTVEKDIVIAILGAAVGLAGVLLVFVGFIYSHGEAFSSDVTKRKYKIVAKLGLLPFTASLVASWFCVRWLGGPNSMDYAISLWSFKICLIITFVYGGAALLYIL